MLGRSSRGEKTLTSRVSAAERKQTLGIKVSLRNESLRSAEKISSSMGTTQLSVVFLADFTFKCISDCV